MTATDKLAGIKPGDRVRITMEAAYLGEVLGHDTSKFEVDGSVYKFHVTHRGIRDFHIERLEKPLEAGDRVECNGPQCESSGCIMAIADGFAMVMKDGFLTPVVVDLRLLERIA